MNLRWATMILLGTIQTCRIGAAEKIRVDVYIEVNNWSQPLKQAKWLASEIFERIDVKVIWHAGELPVRSGGGREIGIRMMERVPPSVSRHAFASARLYGSSICVYEDRISEQLNAYPRFLPVLLGYILVHELAHVMQGIDRHSDEGLMGAAWSNSEYRAMQTRRLGLTDLDSSLIRDGLSARVAAK